MKTETSDSGFLVLEKSTPRDGRVFLRMAEVCMAEVCGYPRPTKPVGPQLVAGVKRVVGELAGVGPVEVQVVMTPPWTPDRMTAEACDELGILLKALKKPPDGARGLFQLDSFVRASSDR